MNTSLVSVIKRQAEENPNKPAFIFISRDWTKVVLTFHDVYDLGRKCAAHLQRLGLQQGDVVCNTVANSPERLITQVGTMMAGCVDMNGQLSLADGTDFISSLNEGSAKAMLYNPNDSTGAYRVLKDRIKYWDNNEGSVECADVQSLKMVIPCILDSEKKEPGVKSFLEVLKEGNGRVFIDLGPDAVSTYMCTSGSTGFFKLVGFYGKNIVDLGHQWANTLELHMDSVYFNDRPLGWAGGYPCTTFVKGCTRVVVDWTVPHKGEFYTRFSLEVIRSEKCTILLAVPLQLMELVKEVQEFNEYNYLLKTIAVGGGPVKRNILDAIGSITERVLPLYGSTEVGHIAAQGLSRKSDPYDDFVCGFPVPGVEVKVVDKDMKCMKTCQIGQILIKPTIACSQYVNNEKGNRETFLSDGWIMLGDRGFLDDQGRLSVLGRGKNAIMRGPIIIYPELTEACLLRCPGVGGVAVVGVPDEALFEEICALIVRSSNVPSEIAHSTIQGDTENVKLETTLEDDERDIRTKIASMSTGSNNGESNLISSGMGAVGSNPQTEIVSTKFDTGENIPQKHNTNTKYSDLEKEKETSSNQLTEEDARKFCKENMYLTSDSNDFSPLPKYYIFVEALPTLSNGKLDRVATKKMAAGLVNDLQG